MKAITCSVLIGLIGFALPAWADQKKGDADVNVAPKGRGHTTTMTAPAKIHAAPRVNTFRSARTSSNVSGTRLHNYVKPNVTRSTAVNRTVTPAYQHNVTPTHQRNVVTARHFQGGNNVVTTNRKAMTNRNVVTNRNVTTNRNFVGNRNAMANRNFVANRNINRNATITNHWTGSRFNGQAYAAFRNYNRQWHDRAWWRSHYNRIVFVNSGWYFWDSGFWYPAWGYDPYAYYSYDGPIYGYADMNLNQEIVDVQTRLQREGYYAGPIDGALGPMTRQAIAAFQADHGLAVTSAIDEPTMDALGIS